MTLGSPMVLLDQRDSIAEASTYPPRNVVTPREQGNSCSGAHDIDLQAD